VGIVFYVLIQLYDFEEDLINNNDCAKRCNRFVVRIYVDVGLFQGCNGGEDGVAAHCLCAHVLRPHPSETRCCWLIVARDIALS
jgi:hypothetical protein